VGGEGQGKVEKTEWILLGPLVEQKKTLINLRRIWSLLKKLLNKKAKDAGAQRPPGELQFKAKKNCTRERS